MHGTISSIGRLTALIALGGVMLCAQDATTGAISGTVTAPNGTPVAGAKVILDGGRGQVVRVTDANGTFKASALIPGQYHLTVTAAGYETATKLTATASINTLTPLRITMTRAAGAVVEVVATTQALDTTAVTSGTSFSSDEFSTMPLGRSFTAIASMAPGVVDGGGTGANNPSISGGTGLENQYVIDGANTTNTGFGGSGSFSIIYGSLGTGINSDFIQEVQVKSFAMEAEYGQSTGGIINAVTKSGSNTFQGSVFAFLDIDSLQAADRQVFRTDGTEQPTWKSYDRAELGFFVSGPIIKDKLFYFVGYNPVSETQKRIAPYNIKTTPATVDDPRVPGTYLWPRTGQTLENKNKTDSYYGKLQWVVATDQILEFSAFGDPGKRDLGPQLFSAFRGTEGKDTELKFGSQTLTLKYNATFANEYFLEARATSTENTFETSISALGNTEWSVVDTRGGATISPNSAGLYEQKLKGENKQFDIKLSRTWGRFDFKIGYLHEDVDYKSNLQRSGPLGFVDPHATGIVFSQGLSIQKRYMMADPTQPEGPNNITPYYRIVRGDISSPQIKTKTKYDAYFLQTAIKLDRLNFKLGVRMEGQEMIGQDQTYKFKASDNIAPRLGVTYDMSGDGKSKLYAFWGRYFEKVPNDICVRAFSNERGVNRSDFMTLAPGFNGLSNPIVNGTSTYDVNPLTGEKVGISSANPTGVTTTHFRTTGDQTTLVIPGTKSMYQDEMVFGFDVELTNGVALSNRFIYRKLGRILEDMSLDGDSYFIANPGENNGAIAALTGFTGTATFPAPTRNYYAFEFEMRKNTVKYSAFMNMRLSKLEGNYEGLFRNDNGQSDPNISSLYDLPVELLADPARGLTGQEQFLIGALPSDRTLVINTGGSYNWDMGLNVGFTARYLTGTPITSYLAHPVYENAGEIPVYGRGVEGRLPSRFLLDLAAQYTFKVGKAKRLIFIANVFNTFNQQKVTALDTNVDLGINTVNPNYMRPTGVVGGTPAYDAGRRVRLGVKFSF
ncbi:TonB-dependent receptor [Geothrix oryzisoli]|uniref:TonB-dependent receptor n=1 Tax=Geothrix oryzisoli TaxID=2922721 RepID=UPI001FAC6842|nr:carboxypeptidase regulatory-like domain-containing protein [Geothrix oryzisoli]